MFSTGQVIIKILEVPFAKLAFKTLLANVIMFLLFVHCVIFLQVGFVYDKKSAFFLKSPVWSFSVRTSLELQLGHSVGLRVRVVELVHIGVQVLLFPTNVVETAVGAGFIPHDRQGFKANCF